MCQGKQISAYNHEHRFHEQDLLYQYRRAARTNASFRVSHCEQNTADRLTSVVESMPSGFIFNESLQQRFGIKCYEGLHGNTESVG